MAVRDDNVKAVTDLLLKGPLGSSAIAQSVKISQPTFSRLWELVENGVVFGSARARKYALERVIPSVTSPIPIFRVSANGKVSPIGTMLPVQGGQNVVTLNASGALSKQDISYFRGLPYFLSDLKPSGFLGRAEPARHQDLAMPDDILSWTDDHLLIYLTKRGENGAGDILIGSESYARFLNHKKSNLSDEAVPVGDRAIHYPVMASLAMQGDPPGSSAGGEQPKFTALVAHLNDEFKHVIVKFSPDINTLNGRRWADLLFCENIALQVLKKYHIDSAESSIIESGNRVFLEVVRFDRTGMFGRSPMVTFAGIDGDLGMLDQSWSHVANVLHKSGKLTLRDKQTVEILDLFGALIGNTDRHPGNIACAWAFDGNFKLLPCYDMLPMFYRPNQHGEIIARKWDARNAWRLELSHLPICFAMAQNFWHNVLSEESIGDDFKEVAVRHLSALEAINPEKDEMEEISLEKPH